MTQVDPVILSFVNEEAQVSFHFLILVLYLTISLRMVGCHEAHVDS
jgi:hypothetical protein